jgi:hypothetical protein
MPSCFVLAAAIAHINCACSQLLQLRDFPWLFIIICEYKQYGIQLDMQPLHLTTNEQAYRPNSTNTFLVTARIWIGDPWSQSKACYQLSHAIVYLMYYLKRVWKSLTASNHNKKCLENNPKNCKDPLFLNAHAQCKWTRAS